MHFFRRTGFISSDFIRNPLIVSYGKPALSAVGSRSLQYIVQMLDKIFRQPAVCIVYDVVYAPEMIDCLHYVIHIHGFISNAYRIGLKYISCLIVSKSAAFNMV